MVRITIKTICEHTGLKEHKVRYRLKEIGIVGTKIHDKLFLYDFDSIEKVKKWEADHE